MAAAASKHKIFQFSKNTCNSYVPLFCQVQLLQKQEPRQGRKQASRENKAKDKQRDNASCEKKSVAEF